MKYVLLFALLLSVFGSGDARAGEAGPGQVSRFLTVSESSSVLFISSGSRTAVPTCAQNFPNRWAIPAGTPMGQAELSLLLTAYAQNKQVRIVGTGNCFRHSDTESVRYIEIVN